MFFGMIGVFMITFNDIKAYHSKLSGVQQALVCALAAYANNSANTYSLNACIEKAQQFLKNGNVNAELQNDENYSNDDLNAVIQYLEYASNYDFPDVYILDVDDENRIIDEDDFICKSLFDYIDVKSTIENLEFSFFDFVIDPDFCNEPDFEFYNDQMFEHEMFDYIEQHNNKVIQNRKDTDYFLLSDERLGEDLLSTDENVLLEKIKTFDRDFEDDFKIENLDGNELRDKFCNEDDYLDYIRYYLI